METPNRGNKLATSVIDAETTPATHAILIRLSASSTVFRRERNDLLWHDWHIEASSGFSLPQLAHFFIE